MPVRNSLISMIWIEILEIILRLHRNRILAQNEVK